MHARGISASVNIPTLLPHLPSSHKNDKDRGRRSAADMQATLSSVNARSTQRLKTIGQHLLPNLRQLLPRRAAPSPPNAAASTLAMAAALEIERVPCLSDNYCWLLHDPQAGLTAIVDPAEAGPIEAALTSKGWKLTHIFNTHHHMDHVGGNLELKRRHGTTVIGPLADKARIPGIDRCVGDNDAFTFGAHEVRVFDTPGHTRGHITYWIPSAAALFPGDTLFALGCGRLFEGDPKMMWASLSKLLPLPDDTRVYCAHEYTQSNARFAVTVDPDNQALAKRKQAIDSARAQNLPTVPSLLGEEKLTNPFLRPFSEGIRAQLGVAAGAQDWEVFGAVRRAKDVF